MKIVEYNEKYIEDVSVNEIKKEIQEFIDNLNINVSE